MKKMIIQKEKLQDFVQCESNTNIIELSKLLHKKQLRSCNIIDSNGKPIGVVSLRDIVYKAIALDEDLHSLRAEDIMTKYIEVIEIESSPGELCTHIKSLKTHNLPITENGRIIGMIDIWTLLEGLDSYKLQKDIPRKTMQLAGIKKNSRHTKKPKTIGLDMELY